MTRMVVAGCMALALLGAVAVLEVAPATVHAGPSMSPYLGTYVGSAPIGYYSFYSWEVAITKTGKITSSYSEQNGFKRSLHGWINDDGSYSFEVSFTFPAYRDRRDPGSEYPKYTVTFESAGTMSLVDGNLVGTTDSGESFTWFVQ